MSAKVLKNNKKNKISKKSYIFWGAVAAAVIVLIISLVVFAMRNRSIVNYEGVTFLEGQDFYKQEEDKYLILFYDFKYEKDFEAFDKDVYTYLEYYRDNKNKDGVLKLYGANCTTDINRQVIVDSETEANINGTTKHPRGVPFGTDLSDSSILRISETQLPILLVVSENSISEYKTGETAIKEYLQQLKK